ncbi:MAG: hydantoinase B/oxoprolinase family protein [Desulfobacteraceae bacterium]|nr:hydantoinase B/oxoprolinase family protein [Desulfobacteraceae bacterium]
MDSKYDHITTEIIQSSVQAAADEMFAAMRRTAMSAIIYEVLDMGTGITDAHGELAGSGAGIPTFVGMLDKAVRRIRSRFGSTDQNASSQPHYHVINPGDVFAVNDPYQGGVTHLNDIILARPVFAGSRMVAWTANAAHWNDVGGCMPGSMSTDATDIFQEGLTLPAIKLFRNDRPVSSVMDLLAANSRMPDFLFGDLWAGVAALRVGERRIHELISRYGADAFTHALEKYQEYGEQVSLKALSGLPPDRFAMKEEQDNGQVFEVTVTITPEKFEVDLRHNPPQDSGPYNLSLDGTTVAAQMVFKSVTSPQGVCNGGTFRPLRVLTRPGTIFEPLHPAAMGFYYETRIRLLDLIWKALATRMPDRLPAGHFGSICGTMIGGIHPDTGRQYSVIEPEMGGWGGSSRGDGNGAQFSACHGETYNCPAEITEMRNGIVVRQYALNPEPGGDGQHRGGRGVVIDYQIRSPEAWLTAAYTRASVPPWPLRGGEHGTANRICILRHDGGIEHHTQITGLPLTTGDVVRIITANGAGWGSPRRRDPGKIADDLRDGYVTPDHAGHVYGYESRLLSEKL